ncbi:TPA: hypothetical protein ACIUI9_004165 [Salmonella enterica subsp. enterica serovar 13,23:b:-]|nr:hypothetical protein [Salmonella enterica subsp. enterica]
MEALILPELEVRHRVDMLLSTFPHKKMQAWAVRQKHQHALREINQEISGFYFLTEDMSESGITARQQRWHELQKKYPEEIIELLFLLGPRGRHLYHQAIAGDRYAGLVLLSIMESALNSTR